MRVSDFHFDLPEELIAQHPPAERGASRMLVMRRGVGDAALRDAMFADLPDLLRADDLLVLNDSRVMPARLFGRRVGAGVAPPSGVVEVLLVEEMEAADAGGLVWRVLVKPGRKVRVGDGLEFFAARSEAGWEGDAGPVLTAEVVGAGEFGERTLRFAPVEDFQGVLERVGHMPLPPYIRRAQAGGADAAEDRKEDRERYQTVYARQAGSAAAPTAGLHFTPEILEAVRARGVEIATVTLHVGLGTFQPVRVSEFDGHSSAFRTVYGAGVDGGGAEPGAARGAAGGRGGDDDDARAGACGDGGAGAGGRGGGGVRVICSAFWVDGDLPGAGAQVPGGFGGC
jgi:S-adenosylmethionine:tRNA ribosyltransferase-isomerase